MVCSFWEGLCQQTQGQGEWRVGGDLESPEVLTPCSPILQLFGRQGFALGATLLELSIESRLRKEVRSSLWHRRWSGYPL